LIDSLEVGSDADLRRFAAKVGAENLEAHLQLAEANRQARGKRREEGLKKVRALRSRITALLSCSPPLSIQALALDGSAIMRILGVGPSPVVGEATRFLLDRVLEEPELNSAEALSEALRNWVRSKRT
jgi:tRNA nucleotidyltransferase (CCA-adding enzyme)